MKIYIYLLPLLVLIACSRRTDDESFRVLVPWPNKAGQHTLQVVEVKTLQDMRKMRGDVAELFIHPSMDAEDLTGLPPNAQFIKSSDGYYVPKDTLTQEMITIYAHMERLRELDKSIGLDLLLSWPRQIGVQTLAVDIRTQKTISENAMYVSKQDVMLFFPFDKKALPISLNSGIIAHEHFHAIFQRIVIDPLALQFEVDTFGSATLDKPQTEEQRSQVEISKNNRFILRALNEGMADVWASIYFEKSEFLSQSNLRQGRDTNPSLLGDTKLQSYVPKYFLEVREFDLEAGAYFLGTQYARAMRRAMQTEKLAEATQSSEAIFVVERMMRLRDLLIQNFNKKIQADILLPALFTKEELSADNCEWMLSLLDDLESEYAKTCKNLIQK